MEFHIAGNKNLVAIDISGSMSQNILKEIDKTLSWIDGIFDTALFDTEIKSFSKTDKSFKSLMKNVVSQGGTDLNSVMNFAKENGYERVIIISDGYYSPFDSQGLRITWLLTEDNSDVDELPGEKRYLDIA